MAKSKIWLGVIGALAALYLLMNFTWKSYIAVRTYTVSSEKLSASARIVLLTDLHACAYGEDQAKLLKAIAAQRPDLVLLGGDMVDRKGSWNETIQLFEAIGKEYPCYYVVGNHEIATYRVSQIKRLARQAGITVLEKDRSVVTINGQKLQLCGVDDLYRNSSMQQFKEKMNSAASDLDDALFSILLVHRPEKIKLYLPYGFDLTVCGHAHGGQVRIPGILNGLYAPGQGLFPPYAGGEYDFGSQKMIVSRGLSKKPYWVPRIFNPPELVVIDLRPGRVV